MTRVSNGKETMFYASSFRIMCLYAYNALANLSPFLFFLWVELPFPRIPKIAPLLYFWVFVVKDKIENSVKSTARCDNVLVRFGFALLQFRRKIKIFSKIIAGFKFSV